MPSGIDGDALVGNMYKNKAGLDKSALDANYVGGFHLGPIGLPNSWTGNIFKSDAQEEAQQEPGAYMNAMGDFLRTLNEALDKINRVPG